MRTVTLIGLGIMGLRAAQLLAQNGFTVRGFDAFAGARTRAMEAGIAMYDSPAESIGDAEVILLFVPGPAETRSVVAGKGGLLEKAMPGMVIANVSTVDPGTNICMSEKAATTGVGYVDAPLLGRPSGAGNWSFLVGGTDVDIRRVSPVLRVLSGAEEKIFHMGQLGNGNKAKLLNNLMFGAINACTAEIMALADRMGLSQKTLFDAAVAAGAGVVSNLYKELAPRIIDNRYHDPNFTVDMLLKDNHLALDMARQTGVPLILGSAIDSINRMASLQGLGKEDSSAVWKMLAAAWRNPEASTR